MPNVRFGLGVHAHCHGLRVLTALITNVWHRVADICSVGSNRLGFFSCSSSKQGTCCSTIVDRECTRGCIITGLAGITTEVMERHGNGPKRDDAKSGRLSATAGGGCTIAVMLHRFDKQILHWMHRMSRDIPDVQCSNGSPSERERTLLLHTRKSKCCDVNE